jgi:hypothetical protein
MFNTLFSFPFRRPSVVCLVAALNGLACLESAATETGAVSASPSERSSRAPLSATRIQISVNGKVIATATLDQHDSARDFAAMLPLNLKLKDYAATEKIADLPRALSTKGAPRAYVPLAGDISYFAPWGNLAIFYKDGHLSSGLVRLGRLDAGPDVIQRAGDATVSIDRVSP